MAMEKTTIGSSRRSIRLLTRLTRVILSIFYLVTIEIRYSHYYPAWGGVNGSPQGRTANGDRWQQWEDRGIACPKEFPFGTQIQAYGQTWTCVDRGRSVRIKNGIPWIDFLTDEPHEKYGEIVEVQLVKPGFEPQ